MSAQRFIRCRHCGLPHEAEIGRCPVTGGALDHATKPRRPNKPPPSEEDYAWEHTLRPAPIAESDASDLDPRDLAAFVGRVIEGKYRVEALLGHGGMGAVYRAENVRIGKTVALKVLYRAVAPGSDAERRFLREARVAGSLGHPNIAEVFDLGHLEDGKPYQVMELLEGESLAERLRREGALPEREALDIVEQVLSALEAAHQIGVVHRDLKPDNVFLVARPGSEARVKLLDFGVSKSLTEHTLSITMTGVVVGTPYYLSPEQARGEREVDQRADIWAMGVTMYETLTGVLPFNAAGYDELLVKIQRARPTPPSRFQARISPAVETVILRALSPAVEERFESATEMLSAVRAARRLTALEGRLSDMRLDATNEVTLRVEPEGPDDPTEVSERFLMSGVVIDGPDE